MLIIKSSDGRVNHIYKKSGGALCNMQRYEIKNKPEKFKDHKLCNICIVRAYKNNLIKIVSHGKEY